jgi:hypothetical protein
LIENNFPVAARNILFGGSPPGTLTQPKTRYPHNHLFKPLRWKAESSFDGND